MNKIVPAINRNIDIVLFSRLNNICKSLCDDDTTWRLFMSLEMRIDGDLRMFSDLRPLTIYGKFI